MQLYMEPDRVIDVLHQAPLMEQSTAHYRREVAKKSAIMRDVYDVELGEVIFLKTHPVPGVSRWTIRCRAECRRCFPLFISPLDLQHVAIQDMCATCTTFGLDLVDQVFGLIKLPALKLA